MRAKVLLRQGQTNERTQQEQADRQTYKCTNERQRSGREGRVANMPVLGSQVDGWNLLQCTCVCNGMRRQQQQNDN